jgi:hypothetical protein
MPGKQRKDSFRSAEGQCASKAKRYSSVRLSRVTPLRVFIKFQAVIWQALPDAIAERLNARRLYLTLTVQNKLNSLYPRSGCLIDPPVNFISLSGFSIFGNVH